MPGLGIPQLHFGVLPDMSFEADGFAAVQLKRWRCEGETMDLAQKPDDEILAVADPIMDNLMQASTAIDYERHIRDFTDRAKAVLSKSALELMCKEYQSTKGFFGQRKFVAVFRRQESVVVVWQQAFTKAPGEFVAELVLVKKGGKYLVDHVMVF